MGKEAGSRQKRTTRRSQLVESRAVRVVVINETTGPRSNLNYLSLHRWLITARRRVPPRVMYRPERPRWQIMPLLFFCPSWTGNLRWIRCRLCRGTPVSKGSRGISAVRKDSVTVKRWSCDRLEWKNVRERLRDWTLSNLSLYRVNKSFATIFQLVPIV